VIDGEVRKRKREGDETNLSKILLHELGSNNSDETCRGSVGDGLDEHGLSGS